MKQLAHLLVQRDSADPATAAALDQQLVSSAQAAVSLVLEGSIDSSQPCSMDLTSQALIGSTSLLGNQYQMVGAVSCRWICVFGQQWRTPRLCTGCR